jgi:hypothetical protein
MFVGLVYLIFHVHKIVLSKNGKHGIKPNISHCPSYFLMGTYTKCKRANAMMSFLCVSNCLMQRLMCAALWNLVGSFLQPVWSLVGSWLYASSVNFYIAELRVFFGGHRTIDFQFFTQLSRMSAYQFVMHCISASLCISSASL